MTLECEYTERKPSLLTYQPEVIILPTAADVDRYAGKLVIQQILNNPDSKLTLATGSSPLGVYQELIRAHQNEGLDMSHLTTVNLDEYCGILKSDPLSYARFMEENLFNQVNIPIDRHFIPNCEAYDPYKEAERYEQILKEIGPTDLVILGIGCNGHIAFNEPGSALESRTRVVRLDQNTIEVNSRFCDGDNNRIPPLAISQGIGNILEGKDKKIMLIAKGSNKAEGIKRTLEGQISSDVPASFLRYHPNTTFVIDKEASSLLGH